MSEPDRPPLIRDGVLFLEGEIGFDGIDPGDFRQALSQLADAERIEVFVDSWGGSAPAGLQIYRMLRELTLPVRVHVEEARSIASVIALAGTTITIAEHGTFMIHDPVCRPATPVNSATLRGIAESLDQTKEELLDIYTRRSSLPRAEIARLMTVEAEYPGKAAVEAGFADEVVRDRRPKQCASCGSIR